MTVCKCLKGLREEINKEIEWRYEQSESVTDRRWNEYEDEINNLFQMREMIDEYLAKK